ncbi:MAG TPA: nuclease-related domain-containing protein [Acidimicrobiales bacterium]
MRDKAVVALRRAPMKTLVALVLGLRTEESAWRAGADGEVEVAWQLRKLGPQWRVLHAVGVGEKASDIDHVVIGPGGIFTLNTKNHGRNRVWVAENTFMVNGKKTAYLRNSRFEAQRASKLLSSACGGNVVVEPVIVVMAGGVTVKAPPAGVHVVEYRRIARWLVKRPAVLAPDKVEGLFEQARRDSTWRSHHPRGPCCT